MAQYFLPSPEVRDLTITELSHIQERTAYKWFRQARWPETDGELSCPRCGNLRCYAMSRERFKCSAKECKAVFTVTSGTAFAWRKLPFKKMLLAIWFRAFLA
ncbi:transposase [Microvirga massiliensis]|uniref:transposase n=1 Tax=Microvirga massiliensis TaxID=1033741 RepID=UPI00062BC24E|nr:transposase [Microvirga massiliensis]